MESELCSAKSNVKSSIAAGEGVPMYEDERSEITARRTSRALFLVLGSLLLLIGALLFGVRVIAGAPAAAQTAAARPINDRVVHVQPTLTTAQIAMTAAPQTQAN